MCFSIGRSKWFDVRDRLSSQFYGPFEILKRVGKVAYRLALPPTLSSVHNVFHVSMLQKYVSDSMHRVMNTLSLMRICLMKRNQCISLVKVL